MYNVLFSCINLLGDPSVADPSVADPYYYSSSLSEPSVADPSVAKPSVAETVFSERVRVRAGSNVLYVFTMSLMIYCKLCSAACVHCTGTYSHEYLAAYKSLVSLTFASKFPLA
jgi:hypothetical protein